MAENEMESAPGSPADITAQQEAAQVIAEYNQQATEFAASPEGQAGGVYTGEGQYYTKEQMEAIEQRGADIVQQSEDRRIVEEGAASRAEMGGKPSSEERAAPQRIVDRFNIEQRSFAETPEGKAGGIYIGGGQFYTKEALEEHQKSIESKIGANRGLIGTIPLAGLTGIKGTFGENTEKTEYRQSIAAKLGLNPYSKLSSFIKLGQQETSMVSGSGTISKNNKEFDQKALDKAIREGRITKQDLIREGFTSKEAARTVTFAREGLKTLIPVYGTIKTWNVSTPLGRTRNVAGDALFVLPVIGGFAKGAIAVQKASSLGSRISNVGITGIRGVGHLVESPETLVRSLNKPSTLIKNYIDVTTYPIRHPLATAKALGELTTGSKTLPRTRFEGVDPILAKRDMLRNFDLREISGPPSSVRVILVTSKYPQVIPTAIGYRSAITSAAISSPSIAMPINIPSTASVKMPLPFSRLASAPIGALVSMPMSIHTSTPVSISASVPIPTSLPSPIPISMSRSMPISKSISVSTPVSTSFPKSISVQTATSTPVPVPVLEPVTTPVPEPVPVPVPTPTPVPIPTPVPTPVPTLVPTKVPVKAPPTSPPIRTPLFFRPLPLPLPFRVGFGRSGGGGAPRRTFPKTYTKFTQKIPKLMVYTPIADILGKKARKEELETEGEFDWTHFGIGKKEARQITKEERIKTGASEARNIRTMKTKSSVLPKEDVGVAQWIG